MRGAAIRAARGTALLRQIQEILINHLGFDAAQPRSRRTADDHALRRHGESAVGQLIQDRQPPRLVERRRPRRALDDERVEVIRHLADNPRELIQTGVPVLFGDYGSGKTNALKYLTKEMRKDGALVAYMARPSVADKPTWHDIARSLFTQAFRKDDVSERLSCE